MASTRRRFGPLFYGTLVLAGLCLLGLGGWHLWPRVRLAWELHTLAADLRRPSAVVRQRAAERLWRLGPAATGVWLDAISGPSVVARVEGCTYLVRCLPREGPPPPRAVAALVQAAADPTVEVRMAAIRALGWMVAVYGPGLPRADRQQALAAVIPGLHDRDTGVRQRAAMALSQFRGEPPAAIEALSGALGDPAPSVRFEAARALLPQPPGSARTHAVAALVDLVSCSEGGFDRNLEALKLLESAEPAALPRTVTGLVRQLAAPDAAARRQAAAYLSMLGPHAFASLPALKERLHDPERPVRVEAAAAIAAIDPAGRADAVETLTALVADPAADFEDRWLTISRIEQIDAASTARPVPALVAQLQSGQPETILQSIRLLEHIGPAARPALTPLRQLLRTGSSDLVPDIHGALFAIDPASAPLQMVPRRPPFPPRRPRATR